ncbi:MAG: glycosyltransferase family 4 protein [Liquorilactobacillus hordei]|uniref:glycosyltransferase family 4 protein n=1 Tax=Liquorilactobacillus hordei TaxID=468911 RepID=UPI0039ED851C
MKKIAIVTSGYLPVPATKGGGVEVLDEYLIKENEKNNYANLTVFSSDDSKARERAKKYRNSNVIFIATPRIARWLDKCIFKIVNNILKKSNSNSYRYIIQRLYYIYSVSRKIAKENYDSLVLENHATLFSVLKLYGNYKKYYGKYYFHLHNEVKNPYGNEKYIKNVTKVLGVSNYINTTLKVQYPEMSDEQFTVVRNAVDHERFNLDLSGNEKKIIRTKLGIPVENFIFLYTGRLNKEKGILQAVEAFKEANLDRATFLVVGSAFFDTDIKNDFEFQLEKIIRSVGDSIKFTGYIPNEKLRRIYAIADVCVIPSIWEDPAPLTVIEAITAGKAIITTNSGGIPEYVNEKNAIVLAKENNLIEQLRATFISICDKKSRLTEMQKESQNIAGKLTLNIFGKSIVKNL